MKKELFCLSVNQTFNELRLLYVDLYKKPFVIDSLPSPKKERILPDVLNEDEVVRIFKSVHNPKQQTKIMDAASSGLSVSELV